MSLSSETSVSLSSRGESSSLSVLVNSGADPVISGIVLNGVVAGVEHDDLVVFVRSVLSNPVAVKNSEISSNSGNSVFSNSFEGSGVLDLVDSLG